MRAEQALSFQRSLENPERVLEQGPCRCEGCPCDAGTKRGGLADIARRGRSRIIMDETTRWSRFIVAMRQRFCSPWEIRRVPKPVMREALSRLAAQIGDSPLLLRLERWSASLGAESKATGGRLRRHAVFFVARSDDMVTSTGQVPRRGVGRRLHGVACRTAIVRPRCRRWTWQTASSVASDGCPSGRGSAAAEGQPGSQAAKAPVRRRSSSRTLRCDSTTSRIDSTNLAPVRDLVDAVAVTGFPSGRPRAQP